MGFEFQQNFIIWALGFPLNIVRIVSELVYNLYTGRRQHTYIGVVIHLLSTMDIAVWICFFIFFQASNKQIDI